MSVQMPRHVQNFVAITSSNLDKNETNLPSHSQYNKKIQWNEHMGEVSL